MAAVFAAQWNCNAIFSFFLCFSLGYSVHPGGQMPFDNARRNVSLCFLSFFLGFVLFADTG